jgi:ferrochelatase
MIDLPYVFRFLLVKGIIAPFRSKKSAEAYRSVWGKNGSPLVTHTMAFAEALQKKLGSDVHVETSMRYGQPSIVSGWNRLKEMNFENITVFPLFPQYAAATTASVFDKVTEVIGAEVNIPQLQFISHFYQHPGFTEAFAKVAENFELDAYDKIVFSYHGLPEKYVKQSGKECLVDKSCCDRISDRNSYCYRAHCFYTSRELTRLLKLSSDRVETCFQSRLPGAPWIQPFTDERILQLAKEGKKRLLVFCPSFVADCLETIEEIGIRAEEDFKEAGGEELTLVPSLNSHPAWIEGAVRILADSKA